MYTYSMNTKTDTIARDLTVGTRIVLGLNIRTVSQNVRCEAGDFRKLGFEEIPGVLFPVSSWTSFILADDTMPLF